MAKCIRLVGQGVPARMSDDDAFQVVERDGDGQYCPKDLWKDWNVRYEREPYMLKLVGPHLRIVERLS